MEISLESSNELQKVLTITLPAQDVESEYQKRLSHVAKSVQLKGFRKGKVPIKVIEKRFGKSVKKEIISELMQKKFLEAIEIKSLQVISQPKFEILHESENNGFQFLAKFDIYPEFEIASFDKIKIETPKVEISEKDLELMLLTLRQQKAFFESIERQAKEGDQVNIDFVGIIDGNEFEGGSFKGGDLVLGSKEMVQGFEDAIVGMKVSENKKVTIAFPSDYHLPDLACKSAEFTIIVNDVRELKLPNMDDNFIQSFGFPEGFSLEQFKLEVKENMKKELDIKLNIIIKNQVISALLQLNRFDVPPTLLANEIERQRLLMAKQLGNEYADPDLLTDNLFEDKARNSILIGLIVNKIAKQENLTANVEKVRERIEELASTYEDAEEIKNWYLSNPLEFRQIELLVLEDQVIDFITQNIKQETKQYTYSEFMLLNQ